MLLQQSRQQVYREGLPLSMRKAQVKTRRFILLAANGAGSALKETNGRIPSTKPQACRDELCKSSIQGPHASTCHKGVAHYAVVHVAVVHAVLKYFAASLSVQVIRGASNDRHSRQGHVLFELADVPCALKTVLSSAQYKHKLSTPEPSRERKPSTCRLDT